MALILTKDVLVQRCFIKSCSFGLVSAIKKGSLISSSYNIIFGKKFRSPIIVEASGKQYQKLSLHYVSTSIQREKICWGGSTYEVLLRKLDVALKDHQIVEAWESFNDLKNLYGFPRGDFVDRLITELTYSTDPHWLQNACNLVMLIWKEKPILLHLDVLTKASLSLARSQMPIPTSMILRLMLEIDHLPNMIVFRLVILHMVKTEIGTYLTSNFLFQICDCFLQLSTKNYDRAKLMKPDTMIFNLVLNACVRFKLSFKGQQVMELMAQTGVIADAHTIVLISQIHEMNGQRDEMKKFKVPIDQVSASYICHYSQFYDTLLSLHFKFNDIDSAAELVLDICNHRKSLPIQKYRSGPQKSGFLPIGSHNLKAGLKIQIMPELMQKDSVLKVEYKQEFVIYRDGKLVLSNRALAKLINGYKSLGKITDLSKILLHLQKELASLEGSNLSSAVINACIHLGWLETAHDILDDMESYGAPMRSDAYTSLLKAYYKDKMFREANAMEKQMKKAGLLATTNHVVDASAKCDLAGFLVREMKENSTISPEVFKLNSSIYFFCKANMIDDARKTYRRMQEMNIQPTVQTFANLAYGYSSLGMHREITILWGDIKRNMQSGNLLPDRDLYEFLLLNFIRGGYFERVTEVVGYMKEQNMYADKWMYKSEFLKLHSNLYRSLKESQARNEAQVKRLEHVRAFRKWIGIDS